MLIELRVQNLLLIEDARLELAGSLNVLTGETGAGKTVLAHALDLLLGGRPRHGIVRPGAAEAYVEGIFELPPGRDYGERLPADAQELVLARRVGADGRTRAYLNGRSLPVGELREIASEVLSFYGQHEHRRLMLGAAQLEILDSYCGPEQLAERGLCGAAWGELRALRDSHAQLRALAGARERELDLLEFELGEIEQAAPDAGQQSAMMQERERLRHVEALRGAAWVSAASLAGEETGAAILAASAAAALNAVGGLDGGLDRLHTRVQALALEAQDLAVELRDYVEQLEAQPGRLEEIEERLAVFARLERKHGGSLESVIAHGDRCRARRQELLGAEVALEHVDGEIAAVESRLAASCERLRDARLAAAPRLSTDVCRRLSSLAMADASFAIDVLPAERGSSGADSVLFQIAPNPGVPAAPLRDIASGGELSRVMLALLGAAHEGGSATLVFDEVDAGIGGHTARAVGEQLRELAGARQVLCITHLPQVASCGERHFTIAKDTSTEPARTTVRRLDGGEVVGELVRMLGADTQDAAARKHAKELLRAA